jgi:hypothetical protein
MPIEAPLDVSIMTAAYRGYTRNIKATENSTMAFASICMQINGRYYIVSGHTARFIASFLSPEYPDETNKPGYGHLLASDSVDATTERRETQSIGGRMVEMKR